jgi:hypothetical protein
VDLWTEHRETKRFNRSMGRRAGGWIGEKHSWRKLVRSDTMEAMIAMGRVPPVRGKGRRREGEERR